MSDPTKHFYIECINPETLEDDDTVTLEAPKHVPTLIKDLLETAEKYPAWADLPLKVIAYNTMSMNDKPTHMPFTLAEGEPRIVAKKLESRLLDKTGVILTLRSYLVNIMQQSPLAIASFDLIFEEEEGGIVAGETVINDNYSITPEHAIMLHNTIQAHAEEFKREAEANGVEFPDSQPGDGIITPGDDLFKLDP